VVPDGFEQGTVTLWGNDYPCLRQSEDAAFCLLYLTDENGQGGALFAASAADPETICPLACVPYSQYAATPAGTEQTEGTDAQENGLQTENRLLLCAFAVVVLFLVIVIVVLLVRKKGKDAQDKDKEDEDIKFIDL